jgi:hypothetical protein
MLLVNIGIVILVLLALFIPKRISGIEIYCTCLFAYLLGMTADVIFDFIYDFYGYLSKGPQISGLVYVSVVYFSINTIYLNFFPFDKNFNFKISYILLWTLLSVVIEVIIVQTPLLYYNSWKWWYSAFLYPIIFILLALNLLGVRKLLLRYVQHDTKTG